MPRRTIGTLEGAKVRLRPLEKTDLPLTLAWRNSDRVWSQFRTMRRLSAEEHSRWYEGYRKNDRDYVFIVEARTSGGGRPIGQISIYDIDWTRGSGTFGRLILGEEEFLGRGFAREAAELALMLAFTTWGLKNVKLEVLPSNYRALGLYRRLGFQEVGRIEEVMLMEIHAPGV